MNWLCLLIFGLAAASAQSPPADPPTSPAGSAAAAGPRPKFRSKLHVPVRLDDRAAELPPPGYSLAWSDEFDGTTLDAGKWDYRTGGTHLSTQLPENVSVHEGHLHLLLRKGNAGGREYTGAGVISRRVFMYGYYEARFRTPGAEGWHTSFWAMRHDGSGNTGTGAGPLELDMCEQDGGDPHLYSFGVINHHPDVSRGQSGNPGRWVVEDAPDTSAGFHVWSAEFTPLKVRFYFDHRLAREMDAALFPHADVNIWLTSIASKLKGDRFVDESKLPAQAVFDYVRFYRNPAYDEAEASARAAADTRFAKPAPTPRRTISPDEAPVKQ